MRYAFEDEVAEPAERVAQDGRDGHEADRRDGRQPQAGDDQRQRQRQFDAPEARPACVAHPLGGLQDVGRALSNPATMARTRMSSVYMTSGTSMVTVVGPVIETSAAKMARLGIV